MSDDFFLSVVIPAYNEEDRIITALEKTLGYLDAQDYTSEVMVVSDGSRDRTVEVARSYAGRHRSAVTVEEYFPNRGKGYAVAYGMLRARGGRILFMDADYAVPIEDLKKAHAVIDAGRDIAVGSRGLAASRVLSTQNLPRRLSARLYTLIQNFYLGIHYPDTQCGFKMFKKDAAQRLFSRQKLSSVIFDAEILWLAKELGLAAGEFPVTWTHVENSRIQYDSLKKSLFIFQELFRIKGLHRRDRR
jgi:dolichyl-phosphate beta-glucosyltransferase